MNRHRYSPCFWRCDGYRSAAGPAIAAHHNRGAGAIAALAFVKSLKRIETNGQYQFGYILTNWSAVGLKWFPYFGNWCDRRRAFACKAVSFDPKTLQTHITGRENLGERK
jgi:hypothetical protein